MSTTLDSHKSHLTYQDGVSQPEEPLTVTYTVMVGLGQDLPTGPFTKQRITVSIWDGQTQMKTFQLNTLICSNSQITEQRTEIYLNKDTTKSVQPADRVEELLTERIRSTYWYHPRGSYQYRSSHSLQVEARRVARTLARDLSESQWYISDYVPARVKPLLLACGASEIHGKTIQTARSEAKRSTRAIGAALHSAWQAIGSDASHVDKYCVKASIGNDLPRNTSIPMRPIHEP